MNASLADLGASLIGAVFIALSIAPTDEVPMVTSSRSSGWLIVIVAASLLIAYSIVFVAGFAGQSRRNAQQGLLQHPRDRNGGVVRHRLVRLVRDVGSFSGQMLQGGVTLAQVIVLGLPAAIGGAAGRLAI